MNKLESAFERIILNPDRDGIRLADGKELSAQSDPEVLLQLWRAMIEALADGPLPAYGCDESACMVDVGRTITAQRIIALLEQWLGKTTPGFVEGRLGQIMDTEFLMPGRMFLPTDRVPKCDGSGEVERGIDRVNLCVLMMEWSKLHVEMAPAMAALADGKAVDLDKEALCFSWLLAGWATATLASWMAA